MAQIGQFTREKKGFFGRIHTLFLNAELVLLPAEPNEAENTPDYRLHVGGEEGPEIGAGWKRTSEKAGLYIAVSIDDPVLPQPIRANLFQNGDDKTAWSLHWNRPRDRAEKD
ncbi:DUF736 domain-containing protein [Labrys neptuniae]|uniref:DUF736 domain-containing protein n=1 Tax=Labrys neptuniae TaxID=376174 RepID=UPI0028919016|nr:DUF736 domain-containing protein [Labrys neptuniae]MDT3382420.1 DUF736 domain-containing protein [Labrys neptuniae]